MSTKYTFNPVPKFTVAQGKNVIKQQLISENQGGSTGDPNMANIRATFDRAWETFPATMAVAAALLANDASFTAATLDAYRDTDAP